MVWTQLQITIDLEVKADNSSRGNVLLRTFVSSQLVPKIISVIFVLKRVELIQGNK